MELIVLGSQAVYPKAGRACSGYLIKEGQTNILLELGTGVLNNLFRWLNPAKLDGIIISHLHPDHFLDIYPLRYFLQFDGQTTKPIKVLAPQGGEDFILQLVSDGGSDEFLKVFEFEVIREREKFKLGQIEVEFFEVPHFKTAYGVKLNSPSLVYSSDCSYSQSLTKAASGAKVFLCEATFQSGVEEAGLAGHLSAEQAGEIARESKVEKLLLTHLWPTLDEEVSRKEAEKAFGGPVVVTKGNERYEI